MSGIALSATEARALLAVHSSWEDGDGAMPDDLRILRHRRWVKKRSGGVEPFYDWTSAGLEALALAQAPPESRD